MLLGLVTLALYWPATHHDFVNYDDDVYVTANVHVQAGLTWENLKWAFVNPVNANWHPLTVLSHMLDCQLYGLNPWGHHLTSILLHTVNTMLVFLLLCRLTGAVWRSALVAALFGWHPLHVESVAWVAERKDVLSTFFGLLALICYARYAEQLKIQDRKSKTCYWLALVWLAFGLMSKPMLVTWPFVMLLLDYWPLARSPESKVQSPKSGAGRENMSWPRLAREKIPFFALAAAVSIVTLVVQKHGGALDLDESLPLGARSGNALISYCRYLGKLLWPVNLAVYYPHTGYWPLAKVLLAGAWLTGLSAIFWMQRRRYPFLLMGWLWFVGTLIPVIQVVQTGSHALADRYTYIPALGVFIMVVWGAYELAGRCRSRMVGLWAVSGAVLFLCLAVTRQQLEYWQDGETLFRHALAVTEDNATAHIGLGFILGKKGRVAEAIAEYRTAISLDPDDAGSHNDLGVDLGRQGRIGEAIAEYETAIRLNPNDATARNNLGKVLLDKGQLEEATSQFQAAIRLKPDNAGARSNLALALRLKNELDKAIGQYREAVRLNPDDAEACYNLGTALGRKGQMDEAISELQAAIRIKPDYVQARVNLGNVLLLKGQQDEAISQYQAAIRLKPDDAEARNNLAHALEIKNAPPGR
jgi:tetratricopeptide (TPR) repeat protein